MRSTSLTIFGTVLNRAVFFFVFTKKMLLLNKSLRKDTNNVRRFNT